jgi:hypothetical protein
MSGKNKVNPDHYTHAGGDRTNVGAGPMSRQGQNNQLPSRKKTPSRPASGELSRPGGRGPSPGDAAAHPQETKPGRRSARRPQPK